jgi:hypothetical protein
MLLGDERLRGRRVTMACWGTVFDRQVCLTNCSRGGSGKQQKDDANEKQHGADVAQPAKQYGPVGHFILYICAL